MWIVPCKPASDTLRFIRGSVGIARLWMDRRTLALAGQWVDGRRFRALRRRPV